MSSSYRNPIIAQTVPTLIKYNTDLHFGLESFACQHKYPLPNGFIDMFICHKKAEQNKEKKILQHSKILQIVCVSPSLSNDHTLFIHNTCGIRQSMKDKELDVIS